MDNKRHLLIILLFISLAVIAQKEDYVWRVGYVGKINFNAGNADTSSISNYNINITETNSSICDSLGNLLFYTNGATIYNKMDSIMLNGDSLNPSHFMNMLAGGGLNI